MGAADFERIKLTSGAVLAVISLAFMLGRQSMTNRAAGISTR